MKKILSILTLVCMCTVFVPCMAFATESIIVDGKYLTAEEADKYIKNNTLPSDSYDAYMSTASSKQAEEAAPVATSVKKQTTQATNKKPAVKKDTVVMKKNSKNKDAKSDKKDEDKLPKTGAGLSASEMAYLISAIGGLMLVMAIVIKRISPAKSK